MFVLVGFFVVFHHIMCIYVASVLRIPAPKLYHITKNVIRNAIMLCFALLLLVLMFYMFLQWKCCKFSCNFTKVCSKCPRIDNEWVSSRVMIWCVTDDKPLAEPCSFDYWSYIASLSHNELIPFVFLFNVEYSRKVMITPMTEIF